MEKKPCPFCGGNAVLRQGKIQHCQLHGDPYQNWLVGCRTCHFETEHASKDLALKWWNTRISFM